MPLAEVKTLYRENFRDIPQMLRNLAEEIEAGRVKADMVVCLVEDYGSLSIYGWGEGAEAERCAIALHSAGAHLINGYFKVST